jgi:hypothetical protein
VALTAGLKELRLVGSEEAEEARQALMDAECVHGERPAAVRGGAGPPNLALSQGDSSLLVSALAPSECVFHPKDTFANTHMRRSSVVEEQDARVREPAVPRAAIGGNSHGAASSRSRWPPSTFRHVVRQVQNRGMRVTFRRLRGRPLLGVGSPDQRVMGTLLGLSGPGLGDQRRVAYRAHLLAPRGVGAANCSTRWRAATEPRRTARLRPGR